MNTILQSRSIPVARPWIGEEEERAVVAVLRRGWISQGPKVMEFEARFAQYVGASHAVAVSSCTAALHLALIAAGIKQGDEVLCPSLSFIATANAILYAGAVPIFVDVDPTTYNMNPDCIEGALTARTRAILLVHQVGLPAAIDEIRMIARKYGLRIVEDAACAVGAEYHNSRIGLPHGDIACFSFHPRKVLTTGEGGMITTADPELATRMLHLRQHAMSVSDLTRHGASKVMVETYEEIGYNYRMTDMQAALGIVQLRRLDGMLARRRSLAQRYTERLIGIPWLLPPLEPSGSRHTYQSYMVRLTSDAPVKRDELMQALLDRGISTRRGIMAIHREAPYRGLWEKPLPVTNMLTDSTIILPLYHEMTDEDHDYIVDCIEQVGR